jgi:hypothetical protein
MDRELDLEAEVNAASINVCIAMPSGNEYCDAFRKRDSVECEDD